MNQSTVFLILETHNHYQQCSTTLMILFVTGGHFWPLGIVIACVCLCVSLCLYVHMCINPKIVWVTTHDPFKLEPPNSDKRCKTPWLRSLLFGRWGIDWQCLYIATAACILWASCLSLGKYSSIGELPGPCFDTKTVFPIMKIPMIKIRWLWYHLFYMMGIPILVRWYLYIEIALWVFDVENGLGQAIL